MIYILLCCQLYGEKKFTIRGKLWEWAYLANHRLYNIIIRFALKRENLLGKIILIVSTRRIAKRVSLATDDDALCKLFIPPYFLPPNTFCFRRLNVNENVCDLILRPQLYSCVENNVIIIMCTCNYKTII